jgi:ribosomal protein S18 acetylase RimI-like enzyme
MLQPSEVMTKSTSRPRSAIIDFVRVRAAVERDAEAVARVHVESWRSTYRGLVPDDYLAGLSVERRADTWRRLITEAGADRGVLVLEDDGPQGADLRDAGLKDAGDVIGVCHYGPTRDDDVEGAGEVTSIYLVGDRWQRGGGTQLLDAAVSAMTAAGYATATLWVVDGNDRARAFYEARAWVHDGAVKVDDREAFQLRELRYVRALDRMR